MKFWLGVTDTNWYRFLRDKNPEDINFWQPSGHRQNFNAIDKGAPFLFKLKSPYNAIGGVGFFSVQAFLPLSVAWDAFGERNGCDTYSAFKSRIDLYRQKSGNAVETNPVIGCLVLTNPIFFNDDEWIPAPANWSNSIVVGKGYNDDEPIGADIWKQVHERLERKRFFDNQIDVSQQQLTDDSFADGSSRYRENILSRVRIGQGAFRIMITQAYQGRCAITGEHTLPVLEAAHIKPFADSGPNTVSNGLLLRSDLHKLFDSGYITVTPEYRIEVSRLLREEFNNGKIYYEMAGRKLCVVPTNGKDLPNQNFLEWHNESVFKVG